MKVLCASLPGPGHTYPMLAVARALASRGHDVTLASGPRHTEDAARAGVGLIPLPYTAGSPREQLRPYEDSRVIASLFAPDVAELKPDVAVVDLLTLGAALACEMNGVPFATLSVHGLHTPSRDLPPFGWGHAPARFGLRWRDAWMRRANLRDLRRALDDLNVARAQLGLEKSQRIDAALSSELVLLPTLPSLEVPRSDWPEHAYVIGPCLWNAGGENIEPPAGDGPVVLVATSTAHEHGDVVRMTLDAVAAVRGRAIVTAGKTIAPPAGARVVVSEFASHDDVIPRCDVVVCNGGHGIVARALSHGVPLVVVPGHGDQRENGYRVARAGAGIRVLKPTTNKLTAALRRVLDVPSYRERARALQAEANALDGPARAAELIEALSGSR